MHVIATLLSFDCLVYSVPATGKRKAIGIDAADGGMMYWRPFRRPYHSLDCLVARVTLYLSNCMYHHAGAAPPRDYTHLGLRYRSIVRRIAIATPRLAVLSASVARWTGGR